MQRPGISVYNSTLPDDDPPPGVSVNLAKQVTIATALDRAGVDEVGASTPAIGEVEKSSYLTAALGGHVGPGAKHPHAAVIST